MPRLVNECHISGYIGRKPEIKVSSGGKKWVKFSISQYDKKNGDKRWYFCQVFAMGEHAEAVANAEKGDVVEITKAIYVIDEYEDSNGAKKQAHVFKVPNWGSVTLLKKGDENKNSDSDPTNTNTAQKAVVDKAKELFGGTVSSDPDVLPF